MSSLSYGVEPTPPRDSGETGTLLHCYEDTQSGSIPVESGWAACPGLHSLHLRACKPWEPISCLLSVVGSVLTLIWWQVLTPSDWRAPLVSWAAFQVLLPVPSGNVWLFVVLLTSDLLPWKSVTSSWRQPAGWQQEGSCCQYCPGWYWGCSRCGMFLMPSTERDGVGTNATRDFWTGKTNCWILTRSDDQNIA